MYFIYCFLMRTKKCLISIIKYHNPWWFIVSRICRYDLPEFQSTIPRWSKCHYIYDLLDAISTQCYICVLDTCLEILSVIIPYDLCILIRGRKICLLSNINPINVAFPISKIESCVDLFQNWGAIFFYSKLF